LDTTRTHEARLVARADEISLYATTTRQGTYCTAVGTPWRDGKTMGDGGSCVTRETVAEPIAAGVRDVGPREGDGHVKLAIVGRVADREIHTVRFHGFSGEVIERPVGERGFFVAGADAKICPDETWTSTFVGLDADGREVARADIMLIDVRTPKKGWPPVCGFAVGPHGPYDD
jgi:hypothetical protein